ncbi:phosphoglycerate dehydrogenase [Flavobacterium columnare]|uniref:phosphoglycerate dehydrogenase n=2 Tax=Flavobacterium columnare TaxID=996 RepID=UPI0007F9C550|nr:phosphoglycerate dehydrogenase [Flavobacterium columnare]ANO47575.1 D-isomer specific 2-hydroxyacid dehydrogenase NAD-binding protein [Flavobacterium columnare]APT21793.1 3-phosphoglycerate dehydrogenase [Flavobacterium columnare]QOG89310.1 phosphoglycerate dehydrogenase [Flavobacterium columnare]QOG91970.1 phosphoglycerate dehydrogenase [Flavobacterium columnare]QOG94634.1 phosphoglycerate dehydrogenase [Flavobacterium columnare]
MAQRKIFIFDFDSTFIQVEALDELCTIIHGETPIAETVLKTIQEITNQGMEGRITLKESLSKRIHLLQAHRDHLEELIKKLKDKISTSVIQNKNFFKLHSEEVYVISNGFKEIIVPIVQEFGIKPENVLANTFVFDHQGNIVGFDEKEELCENKGKALKIQSLKLEGEVIMIGDGYTDYETLQYGVVSKFYAFTENIKRQVVLDLAEKVAPSLDEILYDLSVKASVSYPKNRIQVLLLENIHPDAVAQFEREGYQVTSLKGSLSEEELCEQIKEVSILGIRSKTTVSARVLENAHKLHAIGTFCIGTNQVNLQVCSQKGIAVFNAPYSNTRSVVELAIGEMIMLMRATFEKSQKMHQGIWDKSANGSVEIRGKKLGIVGYGSIGSQLSILAEALGMQVYFYDVVDKLALGNAKKCASLQELLAVADVVSLHVDGRENNEQLMDANAFSAMKNGVVFLNLSRGHIVDMDALIVNLDSGKIRGAAIDVFPYEPKNNDEVFLSALRGRDNVILTPHIGGSTEEAQHDIGNYVSRKIIQYINTGTTFGSVNLPEIQLPEFDNAHRVMHIHENVKGILAQINTIFSNANCNILGQYLKTNEQIGYVITDVDSFYDPDLEKQLKMIPNTIRYRILY